MHPRAELTWHRSCAKLAYSDAQDVISGSKLSAKVDGDHQVSDVEEDLKTLAVSRDSCLVSYGA
jgi:hypothetical protein